MKVNPKKIAIIGLAASVLFGTAGCEVFHNSEPKVYGPPDAIEEESTEETESEVDTTASETEEETETE